MSHLSQSSFSCQIDQIPLNIYDLVSAQEKKIGLEVAALERTGSSKSQLFGLR